MKIDPKDWKKIMAAIKPEIRAKLKCDKNEYTLSRSFYLKLYLRHDIDLLLFLRDEMPAFWKRFEKSI